MRRLRATTAWIGGDSLTPDVVIEFENGVITDVAPGGSRIGAPTLAGIVIPAFANAHSHAFHRALRGRTHAQGGDFWSWRDLMYRVARDLYPDTYRRLAAGVFAEMLSSGITAVGEFHYLHHAASGEPYPDPNAMGRALIRAAEDAGIRLTLIDTCYLAGGVGAGPLTPVQERFSDGSVEVWAARVRGLAEELADEPMVQLAVAAHSVRAVPAKDLPAIRQVADELDLPIHVHLSEQPAENEACLKEHGVTPTQLLVDTGVLGPRATAVHATHLSEADVALLAASGAGVCLCPTTERDLGDGLGVAVELAAAGVEISLGTDSNAVVDMFEEARGLELHDRLRLGARGVHAPRSLLTAATESGGNATGWTGVGKLAVGERADFVVIDPSSYRLAGLGEQSSVAELLFAATRDDITDVFVAGRQVVAHGRHAGAWDAGALGGGLAAVLE